jgi:hypothetical protein
VNTRPKDSTSASPTVDRPPGLPGEIVNTSAFRYPLYPSTGRGALEIAVLKRGAGDDLGVYVAIVPDEDGVEFGPRSEIARWIAAHGTKQSLSDAKRHFPSLKDRWYRR